jgi:hypothetical protein
MQAQTPLSEAVEALGEAVFSPNGFKNWQARLIALSSSHFDEYSRILIPHQIPEVADGHARGTES